VTDVSIVESENLDALGALLSTAYSGTISLVYMDPPFRTGKTQEGKSGSFDDPMIDIGQFVRDVCRRIELAWQLLSPFGCLVVHLDSKTSHYVKVGIDATVGADKFASEIIWRYRRWPSKTNNFQRVHDVLLRYVKTPGGSIWNQLYEAPSASTLETWGDRKQRAVIEDGKRKRSSSTDEASPGVPMGDVWEIGIIAPSANERTGYPTQKPEALLERLVLATTHPGGFVVDPYMGSGTLLAVCKRLGRNAIGIDRNPEAVAVTRERLRKGEQLMIGMERG